MADTQNALHIEHWEHFFSDEVRAKLYPTWWDNTTANHWRHERFLEAPIRVLNTERLKAASWLAIGDGSGHDTWILRSHGFKSILTTDIGVGTLERSLREGHITRYEQANAEKLQYQDDSFDVVLCKEALHHMQRPYSAIYEMIRVAREAVVIIEPQDKYIDLPCYGGTYEPSYESVGNFVYGFSSAEMQKICFGLNLPGVATKNIVDVYVEGCEFHKADDNDPLFAAMKSKVSEAEAAARDGKLKWNYILTVIFKNFQGISEERRIKDALKSIGWSFLATNTNPFLTKASHDKPVS